MAKSDKTKIKPNKEHFLVMRFGGMGDILFATPVIRELAKDYLVDVATNENSLPLLENNPYVNKAWSQDREGPISNIDGKYPVDLTDRGDYLLPTIGLYNEYTSKITKSKEAPLYPVNAVNYFRVIENSSFHEILWPTEASDFINTYDSHFSWAHIDPMSIPKEGRRPMYFPKKEELEWAENLLKDFPKPIIMLQPYASSPVRTYYRISSLLEVLKKQDNCTVIRWEPTPNTPTGNWRIIFFNKNKVTNEINQVVPWPSKEITEHHIRASAAMIAKADLLISADTCVSHLSEALKTPHLTYYTSVASWTRSRDYEYEFTLNSEATINKNSKRLCKCGIIGRDCPRKLADSFNALSNTEKIYLTFLSANDKENLQLPPFAPPDMKGKQPHEYFNTTPQGLQEAIKSAVSKYESLRQCEAYCAKSLDVASYLSWVLGSDRFNNYFKREK